jgi:hypothetical protein
MAEDSDNALLPRGGSLPAPVLVDPLNAMNRGLLTAGAMYGIREKQAQEAWGNILQQSTDESGNVDYPKAQGLAARAGPVVQMKMMESLKDTSALRNQQIANAAGTSALIASHAIPVARDGSDASVNAAFDSLAAHGVPADQVAKERARWLAMSVPDRQAEAERVGLQHLDQLHQIIGQTTSENVGGQIVSKTVTQPRPGGGPGGIVQGPGSITTTASPDTVITMADIVYPATAQDVKDGRARAVGADVRVSGADRVTRFGLGGLLPPGAREVPGTGGGRPGSGVVGADGKPVGPNNQPRLLVVPGTGGAAAPTPAPTGGATAPSPGAPGAGFGAAVQGAPGAPAPAMAPPPPPPAPAVVAPPAVPPPPPPSLPPNMPRAALEGGVQVASNALSAPTVGAAGPPSPLVPGDVGAIIAGMDRARAGGPSAGTQTAYNTISLGPGTEEAQGYKTSAEKLAADDLAATNFQSAQFPYVQALKNYGQGTKTGPTTEFWNQVAGTIRTPLAKLGINVGALSDTTERVDTLGKWLAAIQSSNPVSAKSDAELAQVLKGSASTHINEVAGEDMVKAGLALQRMNVAANREWHSLSPQDQAQHGTYLGFLRDYNTKIDPRAFSLDMLNDTQKANLRTQLKNGSEEDAARFNATLALARRNGLIGGAGSQAMP